MKRPLALIAAVVPLLAALIVNPAPASATPRCEDLTIRPPAGARIESIESHREAGGTVEFPVQPGFEDPPPPVTEVPAYCQVVVTLTHRGAGDHERIEIWLPESGWSGRFQALGGSGYAAGNFGPALAEAVKDGYAVATTDAGATPVTGWTSPWALTDSGRVNRPILENFASRGVHELALVGKSVVRAYYGEPAQYAYWNGCSTGGRQGYVEAQEYPDDFDGILAGAPAVSWDRFAVATLWPNVVMNAEHNLMTGCELAAFNQAAVAACDADDGVTDGVIGDPIACDFDPRTLIGRTIDCDGQQVTLTAADARVVEMIWDGPTSPSGRQLWYGLTPGADFGGLADSSRAFPVAASWVQDFLARDRTLDVSTITYQEFARYFQQSVREYHHVIGSDETDLSAFRRSGGRLLSWQGLSDQLVPVEGTIRYYDEVVDDYHGRGQVSDFYRLFLAPGAAHCQSGAGPAPSDPFAALVTWVEDGVAPAMLPASMTDADGSVVERSLCPYPQVSTYDGHGDPDSASSYRCTRPQHPHRVATLSTQ